MPRTKYFNAPIKSKSHASQKASYLRSKFPKKEIQVQKLKKGYQIYYY